MSATAQIQTISEAAACALPNFADEVICFDVRPRSPFAVRRVPLLARLYSLAYRPWPRLRRHLVGRPALAAYRRLRKVGWGSAGLATIDVGGVLRELNFDARNTQFHALYMPQFLPCYEPETTALVDLLVNQQDVFFDIGANWGWFALIVGARKGFAGTIHAFEPVPSTFADLRSLVGQARLTGRIVCHELALGDRDGAATMSFADGVHSGLAKMADGGGQRVNQARLDSLDLPAPNLIKIDVEEHEYEVLDGARATIAGSRPFLIFENWARPDRSDLTFAPLELLTSLGYRLFFPAWAGDAGYAFAQNSWRGDVSRLALVPFAPLQRGLLPGFGNVVAIPDERITEIRQRISRLALQIAD